MAKQTKQEISLEQYTEVVEWLAINHGNYPSAQEWRQALINKLYEVIVED